MLSVKLLLLPHTTTAESGAFQWYFTFHTEVTGLLTGVEFHCHTRVGTLIVATIYLQLIQNRYMFRLDS